MTAKVRKTGPAEQKPAKIVMVINQKGGVGKTTLVFHFAKAAAEAGKRVLVIDTDTQGNISQCLTGDLDIKKRTEGGTSVIFEPGADISAVEAAVMETEHENIYLLHGHEGLDEYDNKVEVEDRVIFSGELRPMLHSLPFDLIVVDTPPAVGVRHLAPLVWSDLAVIPMEPVMTSVAGFQSVLESIKHAQQHNPALKWMGILNRLNRASHSHLNIEKFVFETYTAQKIAKTLVSRTVVSDGLQEAPAVPVWHMRNAKRDIRELWRSVCSDVIN